MPGGGTAKMVDSHRRLTAILNVEMPSMRMNGSSCVATIVSPEAAVGAEVDRADAGAGSVGPSTTAPAPSPNSIPVFLSSKSVIRVSFSAPISRIRSARPTSISAAA